MLSLLILTGIGSEVWVFVRALNTSIIAEERLQTTLFVGGLVAEHIKRSGAWPASWNDLETLTPRQYAFGDWPHDAAKVRAMINIDFSVSLAEVLKQTPENFSAIRPKPGHADFPLTTEYTIILGELNDARAVPRP